MRSSREHEHNHYQKYRSLSPLDVGAGDDEGAIEIEGTVLGDEEDDGAPLVDGVSLSLYVGDSDDEGALEIEGTVLGAEEDDGAPLVGGISPSLYVGDSDDEGALEIEGTVLGAEEDDGAPLVDGISLSLSVGDADDEGTSETTVVDGDGDVDGVFEGTEDMDGDIECIEGISETTVVDGDGDVDDEGKVEGIVLGDKEDDGAPLIDGISLSLAVGNGDDEGELEIEGTVLVYPPFPDLALLSDFIDVLPFPSFPSFPDLGLLDDMNHFPFLPSQT